MNRNDEVDLTTVEEGMRLTTTAALELRQRRETNPGWAVTGKGSAKASGVNQNDDTRARVGGKAAGCLTLLAGASEGQGKHEVYDCRHSTPQQVSS